MSRSTDRLLTALTVAVAALVSAVFFSRFTAAQLVLERTLQPAAGAVLAAFASILCGAATIGGARRLFARCGAGPEERDPDAVAELLTGAAVFGSILSLVALAGLLTPVTVLAIALAAGAGGMAIRWREVVALLGRIRGGRLAILAPPVLLALAAALAPVNTPDELVYKLAVPHDWLLFGRMVELPLNSNSYFPLSVYMADLAAMVAGATGAKLFHFLLYLATLHAIHRLASRVSGSSSLWPVAVVAWTPALALIAGWAWAEWAVIGLAVLSIERFHAFLESRAADDLAAAAVALGAAASVKYTALPWIAVFVPLAILRLRRSEFAWKLLSAAALVTAVVGGLFYARNAVWTGSPFAPFFLPDSPSVANFRSGLGGWTELALGFDIFHPGIIDDSLGILLPSMVLLSPLALLAATPLAVDLFVIGVAQMLFLVPLSPTARLITLGVVPLAILGAAGAQRLWSAAGRATRLALAVLAGLAFFGQMVLVLFVFSTSWQFTRVLVGAESEEAYFARTRDFHRVYGWIERTTPADAKFLLLGENRSFHLDRRTIAQGNLDGPRVAAWLARFRTPDEFGRELERAGFTHVLVHKPWYRLAGKPLRMMEKEFVLEVTPEIDRVVRGYLSRGARVVYDDHAYVVFELPRR